MPTYAVLRQFTTPAEAFADCETLLRLSGKLYAGDPAWPHWVGPRNLEDARDAFARAAAFLTPLVAGPEPLTVIVDEVDPFALNPLCGRGWSSLLAMLILAFPEVNWVFQWIAGFPGDVDPASVEAWKRFGKDFGTTSLYEPRSTPLFDGYGLRDWVRARIATDDDEELRECRDNIPARPSLAVVLDEECAYSHFEAYMAYSRGFRVHAIASWEEAVHLVGKGGRLTDPAAGLLLSLEDWYLNFGDQYERKMSDLDHREKVLPGLSLQHPRYRRFITVAHRHRAHPEKPTEDYLAKLRAAETPFYKHITRDRQVAEKPASGLYSLWRDLGLKAALPSEDSEEYRGLAPGYIWPPLELPAEKVSAETATDILHSSPGRLKEIAESLIDRAERSAADAVTIFDAIRGAILATQALELLGNKTPTLSLTALRLKHELEAVAECQFFGTRVHFDVRDRLDILQSGIRSLGVWFGPRQREHDVASWNAELGIINRLIDVFHRLNQFDEEQVLQRQARYLHRKLQFGGRLWAKPVEVFHWYAERLVGSFPLLCAAILFWCLLGTIAIQWLGVYHGSIPRFGLALADAMTAVLSVQPPSDDDLWKVSQGFTGAFGIIITLVVIGFAHLSIFISQLYSLITKK